MRINARFDEQAEQQITWLTEATGQSVSHVVREAVAVYYRQVKAGQGRLPTRLLASIGAADSGHADTASDYKCLLAESLTAKHGLGAPTGPTALAGSTAPPSDAG